MKRRITVVVMALAMLVAMSVGVFANTVYITRLDINNAVVPTKFDLNEDMVVSIEHEDNVTTPDVGKEYYTVSAGAIKVVNQKEKEMIQSYNATSEESDKLLICTDPEYNKEWTSIDNLIIAYEEIDHTVYSKKPIVGETYAYVFEAYLEDTGTLFFDDNVEFYLNSKKVPEKRFLIKENYYQAFMVILGTVQEDGSLVDGDYSEAKTSVNTADSSNIALYSILAVLALAGIGIAGYRKKEF